MNGDGRSIAGLLESCFSKWPEATALEFSKEKYTYRQLDERSAAIAGWLTSQKDGEGKIGVFATKEFATYCAIIGIVRAGKAYVPLNPAFPPEKNSQIIEHSGIRTIFGDPRQTACIALADRCNDLPPFVDPSTASGTGFDQTSKISPDRPIYLLYTSGSTGTPKGVLIRHEHVLNYIENINTKVEIDEASRCSQTFALNFDLSMHDIFFTLSHGACLCIPAENELLSPASYVKRRAITHWFSVPSLASMMDKLRQFKPGSFPLLRYALFCGEALRMEIVRAFKLAAPAARFINLYGPTEATIAVSAFAVEDVHLGLYDQVPIGGIFEGVDYRIQKLDEDPRGLGELLLKGKQVITRYHDNTKADEERFVTDAAGIWYRTGDIVEIDRHGTLVFAGRADTQVKIGGFRVELGEIEHAVTKAAAAPNAACFYKDGKIIAVIEGAKASDDGAVLGACRKTLPSYMIPQRLFYLAVFPLNANGKVDRKEIAKILERRDD